MPFYVTVQITCPHGDIPEGATSKESGMDHSHQAQTPEEFVGKIREQQGKPDERTVEKADELMRRFPAPAGKAGRRPASGFSGSSRRGTNFYRPVRHETLR